MAYTKYSLTPANNTAAPPDGAPEGMLPSAVNDTMRDMMAQIRDVGDGIRDGTYTMTAPKITGGTITGAAFTGNTFTSPVISGGTINNATIGATTATTGKFTTLEATGVATFSAGAVGTPAITTTGDTNTGIFFPAADTIAFTEGGAESMRIDSSGNLGIGTASPACRLDLNRGSAGLLANFTDGVNTNFQIGTASLLATIGPSAGSTAMAFKTGNTERMRIDSSGNVGIGTSSPAVKLDFGDTSVGTQLINLRKNGNSVIGIGVNAGYGVRLAGPSDADSPVSMGTISTSDGSTFTERMRIDSSGNLLVNATSAVSNEKLFVTTNASQNIIGARLGASGSNATCFLAGNATGATSFDYFGAYDGSGTKKAGITSAGTFQSATNTYGGTSDERLKENITDATPKLNDLLQVRIRNFNFKADEQKLKQIGVVAQELETVFPGLVEDTPTWNENNESTGTVKNVKYSVFVPMLIKAIQELKAELDATKAEVQALKGV